MGQSQNVSVDFKATAVVQADSQVADPLNLKLRKL